MDLDRAHWRAQGGVFELIINAIKCQSRVCDAPHDVLTKALPEARTKELCRAVGQGQVWLSETAASVSLLLEEVRRAGQDSQLPKVSSTPLGRRDSGHEHRATTTTALLILLCTCRSLHDIDAAHHWLHAAVWNRFVSRCSQNCRARQCCAQTTDTESVRLQYVLRLSLIHISEPTRPRLI
eukprot:3247619-Amphidinium_carterae.3